MKRTPPLLPLLALALALSPSLPAQAQVERAGREALRVCADPNGLPFSNEAGEGFENRLAEMIAADLGVPVTYTWWPQTIGFVRNTLMARQCDLVMGAASGERLMQNTNPYYRSTYALVVRTDGGLAGTDRLADPALQGARIGVVAQTPAVDLLMRNGLTNIEPYQLVVDTRVHQPARTAVEDVAAGRTDAAVLWGPLAGYWAERQDVGMTVVPLVHEPGAERLRFHISMGLRPEEPEWKHWLNTWIAENQPRIDALLATYGVPLLDRNGALITPAAAEPAGYRMAEYLAPVPATLAGATVLDTRAVRTLLAGKDKPLPIDVLPREPPAPAGRTDWLPRPHESLPGAVWLPDTGYGAPTPEQAEYFARGLAAATGGDKAAPLVFFCRRDCWMSWNAAKRALELGYTAVAWYPDGTDGWLDAGRALTPVEPWQGGPAKG